MVALIKEVSVARMKNGAHYDFMKAAWQETDEAYGNLVQRVNALAVVDGDHDYTAFIDTMNQQIVRYRQQALASKKKKADETKKE